MELYQLRSFVAVAGENHLTRAAENLNISQPAVSAHIKTLEEELGLLLFQRTSSGMRLTQAGKLLLEQARGILDRIDVMGRLAASLQDNPRGTVRIGLNRHADFLQVTPLYQHLRRHYPGLDVELHQLISGTVLRQVRSGELDCGFVFGECGSEEICRLALAGYRLCVVGPASFQQHLDTSDLDGLADFPWIGIPDDCPYASILEDYFYSRGLKLRTEVVADQQSAIISMIESGVGLNFMLEEEARAARYQGKIAVWPGGSFPITLSFVYRTADQHTAGIQAVLRVITMVWRNSAEDGNNSVSSKP